MFINTCGEYLILISYDLFTKSNIVDYKRGCYISGELIMSEGNYQDKDNW